MLIVDRNCVINLNNVDTVFVLPYDDSTTQLRFDDCVLRFNSRAEAEHVLADIVDAYEQGLKVYRIVRGRTA